MKNATHNRISRLLPLVVLVGLASPAFPVSAGVNVWTTNGPEGGNIWALAIDPSKPATLYAGTNSGVFKSADSGRTWRSVLTGLINVSALAIDLSAPATLYAGSTYVGVFKSTDGGESWTSANTGLTNTDITAVAIDPLTPATIYAGSHGGKVFKSTNGGASWTAMNTGRNSVWVTALAIDPSAPATIYTGGDGIFKSTSGGERWTAIMGACCVNALAIDPSGTLYAAFVSAEAYPSVVMKTTNGGASWTESLPSTDVFALAVDPSNPAILYAGTGGLYAGTSGVFKSTDGGAGWTAMNNAGLTGPSVSVLAIDSSNPARIYAGTGGGVFEYLTTEPAIDRRIFPVIGSTPGANGTFFRTSVQLHNPGSESMAGRIVFHPSGASGSDTDPALPYSLAPGQTQSIADLLPAMGRSGVGSADIEVTSGSAPIATARVFNDAGPSGTTGFTEVAMRAEEALQAGQTGVLLIPPDITVARFNVGVRTLEGGASATYTLRNAAGAVFGSTIRAFPPNYHEQQDAVGFLRVLEVPPGGSISVSLSAGAAIFYGATVDNSTGDPSLQIARATSP